MSEQIPITVVVIDDEEPIRRFLRAALVSSSFKVIEAGSGEEGIRQIATSQPDVVLLDLGLPDIDGMEVIRRVREWSKIPVIILSARGREDDKVAALELGADDYLTKPFGIRELMARLRVALRRTIHDGAGEEAVFRSGTLEVDFAKRQVRMKGEVIHLTPIEYKLLVALVRHAGRVITHRQLLLEVWGPTNVHDNQYLRQYMGHLRHKLEEVPAQPKLLLTEAGVGYRFADESFTE
ncbi:MAG: response regulator [Bdellovibrionota bacterium]